MRELTVKELREALEGVPDDLPVRLSSDTGVDQGIGEIIVEKAIRVAYGDEDYFDIYVNDRIDDEEEGEELTDEAFDKFIELIEGVKSIG